MKYGVKEEEKKWFQRLYLSKGIREIDPRLGLPETNYMFLPKELLTGAAGARE